MGRYSVFLRRSASAELGRIPRKDLKRMIERIKVLETDAWPSGCEKLSAQERYRLRQGDYRIVYEVDDESRTIDITKIEHRSEIYKR